MALNLYLHLEGLPSSFTNLPHSQEVFNLFCRLAGQNFLNSFNPNYALERRTHSVSFLVNYCICLISEHFAFNHQAWPRLLIKSKNALKLNKYKNLPRKFTECF